MIQKDQLRNRHGTDPQSDVKVVCAWCGKVLKKGSGETVSHHICQECYEREMRPIIEDRQRAKAEQYKLPPQEFDWFDFLERHMHFSFAVGIVCCLILLAVEGLHWISGGRVPSLIEWIVKKPPLPSVFILTPATIGAPTPD